MELILSIIKQYKYTIIAYLLCIMSFIGMFLVIKKCSELKQDLNNNVIALTDSIKYYKDKNGELIASKTLLQGDLSTLKIANDSLYNVIKNMKVKNPTSVVYIESTINNEVHDTTWIIKQDTIGAQVKNIERNFEFNNDFRCLEGNVFYTDSILGLQITKDKVFFDYTIAIEKNKVYVKSNNPYLYFNNIEGVTIPKYKYKWSIGIGPQIGYGYNFVAKKNDPYIGIGINLNYNILQW